MTHSIHFTAIRDLGSIPAPTRRFSELDDDNMPPFGLEHDEVVAHLRGAIESRLEHGQLLPLRKAHKLINTFSDDVGVRVETNIRTDMQERDATDHEGLHTTVPDRVYFEGELSVTIDADNDAPFAVLKIGRDEWQLVLEEAVSDLGMDLESLTMSDALTQTLDELQRQRDNAIDAAYTIVPTTMPAYLSRYVTPTLPGEIGHLTITALDQFAIPLYANDPSAFLPPELTGLPVSQLQHYIGQAALDVRSDRKPAATRFPHYPQAGATPEQAHFKSARAILEALSAHAGHPSLIGFLAHSLSTVADNAADRLAILSSVITQTQYVPFTPIGPLLHTLSNTPEPVAPNQIVNQAFTALKEGTHNLPDALGSLLAARKQLHEGQFTVAVKAVLSQEVAPDTAEPKPTSPT